MDKLSYIERTFCKRECNCYVPSAKDVGRCRCGQTLFYHEAHLVDNVSTEGSHWSPVFHTLISPTDAYGTIDFLGGPHPNKAHYLRLASDTRVESIFHLLTRSWALEYPKLVITVHGGKANFDLDPHLKKVFAEGLLKTAKTAGGWIITNGTHTGVTRHVGDALVSERSPRLRAGRVVSIGVVPWGVIANRHLLVGRNKVASYPAVDQPRSKYAELNNRHSCFLLADNGTVGQYGADVVLRRNLERFLAGQKLHSRISCSIPIVCVVLEGGMHTIRHVLEYVTENPPVPVVVCEGSGRAADLLAFAHKYTCVNGETSPVIKEQLVSMIKCTFRVSQAQAEKLQGELLQCAQRKNLITVFNASHLKIHGDSEAVENLDEVILRSLFRSQHLTAAQQLSLALSWNRADIASKEIFRYGREWPQGILEEAMMDALVKNRVDFVRLLLANGVQMSTFVTIPRLEELYNSNQDTGNTLRYIVRDVKAHIPHDYSFTLLDIGLVINKLMGGAFRSFYTRRKFRSIYRAVTSKKPANSSQQRRKLGLPAGRPEEDVCALEVQTCIFKHPFSELLKWAVLTKRHSMALLMWQHGEEALAKALVACKLNRALAHEAADDDLEMQVYDELRSYASEFETLSLELLDYCYRQDEQLAQQLLTCVLPNWSRQTCLGLAVACNHRTLLAHPCSQMILADLWLGGLRTRRYPNLQVALSILLPPFILRLEFKSVKELQLMPQTEEEHLIDMAEENGHEDNPGSLSSLSHSEGSGRTPLQEDAECAKLAEISRQGIGTDKDIILADEHRQDLHKRKKPLRLRKKLYEFYAAPITKFWTHSMAYVAFLMINTYMMLVKLPDDIQWAEGYVIAYMATFALDKVREILACEPVQLNRKLSLWASYRWNVCDAVAVVEFFVGLVLRTLPGFKDHGRVLYCLNIVFWYIRILRILWTSKFLGPFVTMIGDMVKSMIYFVALLAVVLMSYGVFRQSLLFPNEEPSWYLARHIFFQPYFMIYGEVFADEIDPVCGEGTQVPCVTGRWLNPLLMAAFLLMANILLLNLLIAVFNSIFIEANANSQQIWKFNRFGVVMEYEQKPTLPPPFVILSHLYLIVKWCRRGYRESYDHGLKLFLNDDDLERLYDFEEECMEGLSHEKEDRCQQSLQHTVHVCQNRIDQLNLKLDGCLLRALQRDEALQSLRLRWEEEAQQLKVGLQQLLETVRKVKSAEESETEVKSTEVSHPEDTLNVVTSEMFARSLSAPLDAQGRRSSCVVVTDDQNETGGETAQVENPNREAATVSDGPLDNTVVPDQGNLLDAPDGRGAEKKSVDFSLSIVPAPSLLHRKNHSAVCLCAADSEMKTSSGKGQRRKVMRAFSEAEGRKSKKSSAEHQILSTKYPRPHWPIPDWMAPLPPCQTEPGKSICASCENNAQAASAEILQKVEAEAEHLRQVEGYSYQIMEDIIEKRLLGEDTALAGPSTGYFGEVSPQNQTLEETWTTSPFVIEAQAMESDAENHSDAEVTPAGPISLLKMATNLAFVRKLRRRTSSSRSEASAEITVHVEESN